MVRPLFFNRIRFGNLVIFLLSFTLGIACGTGADIGNPDPTPEEKKPKTKEDPPLVKAQLHMRFVAALSLDSTPAPKKTAPLVASNNRTGPPGPIAAHGQAAAADVTTLAYYFSSIKICETGDFTGTGYQNATGCIDLLRNNSEDYAAYGAQHARNDDGNYVNLMDVNAVDRHLARVISLDANAARSYHFGVINWYQPIKVQAKVRLNDGNFLYTKDGNVITSKNGHYITTVSDLTQPPARKSIIRHNNGGAWFAFQKPFVITPSDITAKKNFVLDLVFNADKTIRGAADFRNASIADIDSGHGIDIPRLGITPIVHAIDDPIRRESYVFTYDGNHPFGMQVELYSLESAPLQNILGVDITTYFVAHSTKNIPMAPIVYTTEKASDGSLILKDWKGDPVFSGFMRLDRAGQTGTADVSCPVIIASDETCPSKTVLTIPYVRSQ